MLKSNKLYLSITGGAFGLAAVVLNFFPRSTFSERERRELAEFPQFSAESLWQGEFTDSVSKWYSDSEPFRDFFLNTSENFNRQKGFHGENEVSVVADVNVLPDMINVEDFDDEEDVSASGDSMTSSTADTVALLSDPQKNTADTLGKGYKQPNNGIYLVGSEPNVFAMIGFTSTAAYVESYASAANTYKGAFPDVNIWVMPVPTSIEYYCPDELRKKMVSQKKVMSVMFSKLNDNVNVVDIWQTLQDHKDEHIYLRTDHHWSPLGAFYASEQFANQAGLPFKTRGDGYEERVVHGFVGSMYGYSHDVSVKRSPEDFIFYFPKQVDFQAYYIQYNLDKDFNIESASKEYKGKYFCTFKDGSGGAYCTFMGSDARITRVETGTHNGRRLIIIKDSYGNAVPSNLFYSFEQVHVIDYRYFTKNMRAYVEEHAITDILFCNNMTCVCNPQIGRIYKRFLNQSGNIPARKNNDSTATQGESPSPSGADSEASTEAKPEQVSEPESHTEALPSGNDSL